jgi:hypothetical protein
VSRRVSLPGADELFRRTSAHSHDADPAPPETPRVRPQLAAAPVPESAPETPDEPEPEPGDTAAVAAPADDRPARHASGRVRHDEKMTVYVTADELLEIEHARLVLRRATGRAIDRGRLVRAAVAMALADLDEHGADGELARRLSGS